MAGKLRSNLNNWRSDINPNRVDRTAIIITLVVIAVMALFDNKWNTTRQKSSCNETASN